MENRLTILGTEIFDPMEGSGDTATYCECRVLWETDGSRTYMSGKILLKVPQEYTNSDLHDWCVEKVRGMM